MDTVVSILAQSLKNKNIAVGSPQTGKFNWQVYEQLDWEVFDCHRKLENVVNITKYEES